MEKKKLPYFPLYPGDFIVSTAEMTDQEVGAYVRLLCHQWTNNGLPADPERLQNITQCKGDEFKKIWSLLKYKFQDINGRLFNKRLEEERTKVADYIAQKSASGKKGAAVRWGKEEPTDSEVVNNPDAESNDTAIATPLLDHSESSDESMQSQRSKVKVQTVKEKKQIPKSTSVNGDKSPFMDKMKSIYLDWDKELTGGRYIWTGKDNKALGGIVAKIKKLYKVDQDIDPQAWVVEEFFGALLRQLPKWYIENNSELSTINGKFNDIVKQIQKDGQGSNATRAIVNDIQQRGSE